MRNNAVSISTSDYFDRLKSGDYALVSDVCRELGVSGDLERSAKARKVFPLMFFSPHVRFRNDHQLIAPREQVLEYFKVHHPEIYFNYSALRFVTGEFLPAGYEFKPPRRKAA